MTDPSQAGEEPSTSPPADIYLDQALEQIRRALVGLRFGEVTVIVQDGVVIQVERTERRRLKRGER